MKAPVPSGCGGKDRGHDHPGRTKVKGGTAWLVLSVLFYIFIFIFALIGAIRGWAKEVTALFSTVLALFILTVLQSFIPAVKTYMQNSPVTSQVTFRMAVVGIIAFVGYQTPNLPVFMQSQQFKRGQMQDVILGFLVGGLNGFMIFGSIWYFMDQGGYPFYLCTGAHRGHAGRRSRAAAYSRCCRPSGWWRPRFISRSPFHFCLF